MEETIAQFLDFASTQKRFSLHTIEAYSRDLRDFRKYLDSNYPGLVFNETRHIQVRSWLAELRREGISARSINRKLSSLRSFFKYHHRLGRISSNPCASITALKTPKRLVNHVPEKAMSKVLETPTEISFKIYRDHIILLLLYATGMRRGELVNLQDGDITRERQALRVVGKGNKVRQIPIAKSLLDQIQIYQDLRDREFNDMASTSLLVTNSGRPVYPKFIYNCVRRKLGDVSTLTKRSPHVLRHSFATHLSAAGADINAIKELLGHANLGATQIYTHTDPERLRKAYLKAHPKSGN